MPDLKARIRNAFATAPLDDDIVEELLAELGVADQLVIEG